MHTQSIASAITALSGMLSEPEASFEGLAALHEVRQQIDDLFGAYAAELRADPTTEPVWRAVAAAMSHSPSTKPSQTCRDARVEAFWSSHSDAFTWDFLPMEMVHEVYTDWMRDNHPAEHPLPTRTFSKRLRQLLPECGAWRYTRSRAGSLMRCCEPLALKVGWRHDGSDAAMYGLRRQSA